MDRPIWMLEARGEFTVRSAWQYIRRSEVKNSMFKEMWVKGMPFKIAFFMWRIWQGRF